MPTRNRARGALALMLSCALLIAMGALLAPAPSYAEMTSLFGRSPAFASYHLDPVITADSRFVIFIADLEQDGVNNLYRAPLAGGEPVRLSAVPAAGAGVRTFKLSPDGTQVVYVSAQEVENREELYSVPLESGAPVKLSGPLPSGGNVGTFEISPNSAAVLYWADQDTNDVFELYQVLIGGGQPTRLNAPLVAGGDVRDSFTISHNSQFVVYQADQAQDGRDELFSVALVSGDIQQLSAAGGKVDYFRLSPVLNIGFYVADQGGGYELFSVQLNGNPIGKLSGTLPGGKRVTYFDVTPDGQRLLYTVGKGFGSGAEGALYSVSAFGGASAPLSPSTSAGGDVGFTRISANSATAVFSVVRSAGERTELFSAPVVGGSAIPLLMLEAEQSFSGVDLSPDSAWLVLGLSKSDETKVVAMPVGGGTPVTLSQNRERAFSQRISPQSDRVIFTASDSLNPDCRENNGFSVQIFGGGRRQLTSFCGTGVDGLRARFISDGRILYATSFRTAQNAEAGFELFVSDGQALPPTATPAPTRSPVPAGRGVWLPLVRR